MKKSIISSLIGASLACTTVAAFAQESLVIRVPIKQSLSSWSSADPIYHPWTDVGEHYACGSWSPEPNTINYGTNFTQSRDCSQDQQRDVEIREKDSFSSRVKTVRTDRENRTINEGESQTSVGTYRDWRSTDSTYTEWSDYGTAHTYSAWSPAASTQTVNFTQTRSYKQPQERDEQKREMDTVTGEIRNTGSPIRHTQDSNRSESRAVVVDWTSWSVTRNDYNCGTWSPATNTKGYGESFTQTRSCSEDQSRTRNYKVDTSTIHSAAEARTISVTQSQSATGAGNWEAYSASCGSWSSTGNHSYGSWSPAHGSQTSNYTQTQSYKQDQSRTCQPRERDTISGTIRNTGSTYSESQTVNLSQPRTITVSGSGWSNTTKSGYSSYSPAAGTQTSNFTQTRTYTQNQEYTYTHKAGSTVVHTRDITRALSGQSESRTVTATWSGWSFNKNHSYSGYSPSTTTVCSGTSFTQTETYKRQEKRTISYNIGGTGPIEYKDLNQSRSRSATGTKSCGGNWNSGSLVYQTPYYTNNCPGAAQGDLTNKGYSTSAQKNTGSCTTLGTTHYYTSLNYAGGSCQGFAYKQTCQ